jgi:hypothetical protein
VLIFIEPMPKSPLLEREKAEGSQLQPGAISGSLLSKNQKSGE